MKKTLLATSALALIAATAGAVDVEMYGQVNKAVLGYSDGQDNNLAIVDNGYSSTRLGVKGAQALDNGLTASALFEGEMVDNAGKAVTQSGNANTGNVQTVATNPAAATFTSRQARVGLSGNFGGVYVGQQSVATDSVLATDLAGAQDVMGQDISELGGALQFRNKTSKALIAAATTNAMTGGASGFGDERANSIRYDSPIFAGFQGRASAQQGGDLDLAAFYEGAMGDFKMGAAAGVQYNNDTAQTAATEHVETNYGGSVSVAHSSGLAATLAYQAQTLGNKPANADEANGVYAKVGYAWDAFEVAADYSTNEHFRSSTANQDSLDSYGLAAQYNLGHGVSVAGLYRNMDAEYATGAAATTRVATDSIDLYGVNMRVKF